MSLPDLPYRASIMRSSPQTKFGGLNHNPGAVDGEIYDMENLSSGAWPLLSPRGKRGLENTITSPGGIGAKDKPWWVSGTKFYYDGTEVSGITLTAGQKEFAAMGNRILIFPDRKYYDASDGTYGDMGASASGLTGVGFQNGSYEGVAAECNTIYKAGVNWSSLGFQKGDAVKIAGCITHPENIKTAIIREIDGSYLRFYENTFVLNRRWRYVAGPNGLSRGNYTFISGTNILWFWIGSRSESVHPLLAGDTLYWNGNALTVVYYSSGSDTPVSVETDTGEIGIELAFEEYGQDYTETGTITITREVPALEHVCVNENRLWGCAGDTIYASKLGDPFNFNVFDGLSTDSWQSENSDAGDFTACVSYLGYPVFFKEDMVYKVYGDKPSNFQWTPSARLGVKAGCAKSLAIAAETLFYLSPAGICAYTGGIPSVISGPLGEDRTWSSAAAGSDNLRYYVSMTDGEAYSLFVYDTRYRAWHREDATQALGFAFWDGGLHMLASDGKLWRIDGTAGTPEDSFSWTAEFADFARVYETSDTGSEMKKGLLRLLLRCELGENAHMDVMVRYDSRGDWLTAKTITTAAKKSFIVPLILRRCDHFRLKLTGTGDFKVWSLAPIRYSGSHLQ